MRLVRLRLQNFRQHADTDIEFRPGLTGIIGPNGAGKSTILEAIAWSIYGAQAARGTNETIRFSRAPARSRVEVELTFELAAQEYRVARTMHSADVYVDGGGTPVASGLAGATAYLETRLGMSRDEFFNTYFTGQKELQFLAQLGPTQRGRFLSRLLGYERLRIAQDRARTRRSELRHELDGLRAGMADPAELEARRAEADAHAAEARVAKKAADSEKTKAARKLGRAEPRWAAVQAQRERDRELAHAIDSATAELDVADRDIARIEAGLEEAKAAAGSLDEMKAPLALLTSTAEAVERMESLARAEERRGVLDESAAALDTELAEIAKRLDTLEQAPALVERYRTELSDARAAAQQAEAEAERLNAEWSARRQEVSTRLESYRKRARELKQQIKELTDAGPDGSCPTCERPLGAEFDNVVARLEDELLTQVQDGKWLAQRETQLAKPPDDVAAAGAKRDKARAAGDDCAQRLARCEQAVQELWTLGRERKQKTDRRDKLRAELKELPSGYDAAEHARLNARSRELREIEKQAAALERAAARAEALGVELKDARGRRKHADSRLAELRAARAELRFDGAKYEAEKAKHDEAAAEARAAELRQVEAAGRLRTAEAALDAAERALRDQVTRQAKLESLEVDVRHHNELDAALTRLRGELNARVRPELADLASAFLADITDGRYAALEIDDAYNIVVLDEGEAKPVISGGEEDIANLVLRLAISQMIAERAGQQLSILILDEVFGSLDVERRDNVIALLHKLEARFEQVILITHIDTIREGLDNVLRVEFDERSGASRVLEESIAGAVVGPVLVR